MPKVNVHCNICMRKIKEREIPAYFDYFEMLQMKHTCLACRHKLGEFKKTK
jgi:hypothetical protein